MKRVILFCLALSLLVFFAACSVSSGGTGTSTGEDAWTTTLQTDAETDMQTDAQTAETTAETTAPPQTIPTDGLSMPDTAVVYDGEPHSLTLLGEIPDGVTVTYSDNTLTDVGITTAFATLSMDGAEDVVLSGILTVSPAPVDLSQVRWSAVKLGYDGEEKKVTLIGLPSSVSVAYTDNAAVAVGRYHAVATVTAISDNYRLAETVFTLDWSIVEGAKFRFSLSGGTADQPTGELFDGTTVRVTPDDPDWFLGWSLGATLANGGQFITGQADYSFRLNSDTALFANYTEHTDGTIVYDLTGGQTKADGKGYATAVFSSSFHLCYSTVVDNGTFFRRGYTLLEYNTEPDGSGTPVNPGGKIPVPAGAALHLYAVWAKWSPEEDFIYTVENGEATVVSYLGDDDPLVIPEKLGGCPVTRIAADAVVGKSFVTLSLPRTVATVERRAFVDCMNFDVFYLCDTMAYIYNESFTDCRPFTLFCYNAGRLPANSTTLEGCFSVKFEQLLLKQGKTMVFVSGSSSLNGLNSAYMEELLGGEYHVINYGTNAMVSGAFYMDVCSKFLGEGDILVNAPEYGNKQYGSLDLGWKILRNNELCYNIFRYVDISDYLNVLPAITELNVTQGRLKSSEKSQTAYGSGINQHGDLISNKVHTNFSYGTSKISLNYDHLTDEAAAGFNFAHKKLADAGVRVYYGFPPIQIDVFNTEADFAGYNRAVDEKLLYCTRISGNPAKYAFPYTDMYNSTYHLTADAARVRTELLAAEILEQIRKDAIGDTSKPADSPEPGDPPADPPATNRLEVDEERLVSLVERDFDTATEYTLITSNENAAGEIATPDGHGSETLHITKTATGFNPRWRMVGDAADFEVLVCSFEIMVESADALPLSGETAAGNLLLFQISFSDNTPYMPTLTLSSDRQHWYLSDLQSVKGGTRTTTSGNLDFGVWYTVEFRIGTLSGAFRAETFVNGEFSGSSTNYYDVEMKRQGFSAGNVNYVQFNALSRAAFSVYLDDVKLSVVPQQD